MPVGVGVELLRKASATIRRESAVLLQLRSSTQTVVVQEDEQTLLKRLSKLVSERHLDLGDATQETFQACLARYLRAANGDVAAALAAIEATVKWRTDIKLSLLRTQSAAQICGCNEAELARHFAVQTVVPIDGTAPGLLIVWRLTDLRLDDLLLAVSPNRLLRYYVWLRDRHCKALHDPARAAASVTAASVVGVQAPKSSPTKQQPAAATEGSAAPTFRVVVDVGGVQLANLSLPALKLIRQLIAVDTRHYPGLLHSLDFVNAPPAFPFVWAALKPLLAQSTAAKVKVYAPADRGWRSPLLRYAALLPAVYVRPALTATAAAGSSALFDARAVAQRGSLLGATLRWLRDALWRPAAAAEVVIVAYGASPAAAVAALQSTPAAGASSSSGTVANAVPLLHPEQLLQLVSIMNAAATTGGTTTNGAGSASSRGTPSPLRTPQRGLIRRATVGSGSSAEQQPGGRRSPVQHVRHYSSGASPSTSLHSRHPAALSIAEGNEGSSGSSATPQQRSQQQQQQQHRVEQLYGAEVAVMDTSEGPTAGAAADKVQIIATFSISVQAEGERWIVSRRLLEFVALRRRLLALKLLRESESWDRGGKLWALPPTLHPPALARGMEAFLRVIVQHPVAAMSQEVNVFLGNLALTAAPQGSPATPASDASDSGSTVGATAAAAAVAAASTAAAAVAVEAGHFFADDSEEEASLDAETAYVAARALPSARPELRDVVSDAGSSSFAVRGAQYLTDRRKVSAGASALQLLHADVFEVDAAAGRVDHIALHGRAARRLRAFDFEGESAPFVFIVNFQLPGSDSHPPLSLVLYWGLRLEDGSSENRDPERLAANELRFRKLLLRYAELPLHGGAGGGLVGGDWSNGKLPKADYRNSRLKAIAAVQRGPWVVKKCCNSGKPSLLSSHTTLRHFRGLRYVETDVDVASSRVTQGIVGTCMMFADALAMDVGFVLEGRELDELPEALLGAVHLRNLDPDVAEPLYDRPTNQLLFSAATAATTAIPRLSPGTCSGLSAILGMPLLRRALWGAVAEPADVLSSSTDAVTSSSSGSLTSAVTDSISSAVSSTLSSTLNSSNSSISSSSANANSNSSNSNGSSSSSSSSSSSTGGAFVLRGPTWCKDAGRVQGGSPLCRLVHAELYAVRHPAGRADHISLYGAASRNVDALRARAAAAFGPDAELLIINIQMLGESAGATNSLSLVLYWAVPSLAAEYYEDPRDVHATSALRQFFDPSLPTRNSTTTIATAAAAGAAAATTATAAATTASTNGAAAAASSTAHASSNGTTASTTIASSGATEAEIEAQLRGQCAAGSYCSDRLKLIPRVVDSGSSRTAKKALQSVAEGSSSSWSGVLVGKRLRQRCFRVPERHYLEVCIEGGSSGPLAARALTAWLTHSKEAVLDLGITLEARTPAELPERLLGAVRLHHLDMQRCPTLLCGSDGSALTDALEPAVQRGLAQWRQQQQQQQQQCASARSSSSCAGAAGSDGSSGACASAAAAAAAAVCTEASWGNASSEGVSMTADELAGMFLDNSAGHQFQLRGATYLEDKVKQHPGPALATLVRMDAFLVPDHIIANSSETSTTPPRIDHICSMGRCARIVAALTQQQQRNQQQQHSSAIGNGNGSTDAAAESGNQSHDDAAAVAEQPPPLFVVNFQIPAANPFSLVAFFALPSLDPAAVHPDSAPATALLARYMNLQCESEQGATEAGEGARGYSDLRNKVFKVVPSVRNGPYFVKRATGSKPALLGRKLTQRYFAGPGYMETCIDVGSNSIASAIVAMCVGYAKALTIDVGITLEGQTPDELPERLVGCLTIEQVDVEKAQPLYGENEEPSS